MADGRLIVILLPPLWTPTAFEAAWREAQKRAREGEALPKPSEGAFHFEAERLLNVIRALEAGDISDCKANDVKHAIKAMTHVCMLADLVPDFLDEFMHVFTRHFAVMHHKAVIGEMAQKRADAEGFGQEWREAIEAGNSPSKKDFLAKMVAVAMKAEGLNQNQAIRQLAEHYKTDPENIARQLKRSKKRAGK